MKSIDVETARRVILAKEVDHREVPHFTSETIAYTMADPNTYQVDSREGGRLATATIDMRLLHQVLLGLYGELPDVRYSRFDSYDEKTRSLLSGGHRSLKHVIDRMEQTGQATLSSWMLENPLSGRQILLTTSSGKYSDTITQKIWSFAGTKGRARS